MMKSEDRSALDIPQVQAYAGRIKAAGAIGFGLPATLWLVMLYFVARTKKPSIHGDARFARAADLSKHGLFKRTDNGILVGTSLNAPWSVTVIGADAGMHTITARATDDHGLTSISRPALVDPVTVTMLVRGCSTSSLPVMRPGPVRTLTRPSGNPAI